MCLSSFAWNENESYSGINHIKATQNCTANTNKCESNRKYKHTHTSAYIIIQIYKMYTPNVVMSAYYLCQLCPFHRSAQLYHTYTHTHSHLHVCKHAFISYVRSMNGSRWHKLTHVYMYLCMCVLLAFK